MVLLISMGTEAKQLFSEILFSKFLFLKSFAKFYSLYIMTLMGKQSREKREKRQQQVDVRREALPRRQLEFYLTLEQICLFIITGGVYLVLFAPLWVYKYSFFPFVTPKTIFFRMVVEIILTAYLFLALAFPKYRPKITNLTIAVGIFLAVLVFTSFTGINFERSFWSTYERQTGLFTFFHLFAFLIILSSVFQKREDWERIFGVAIVVGVLLSLYVLFGNEVSSRGGGTIGNTSFMAAYLLFDIFFAIIFLLADRGFWRYFAAAGLLVMIPTLLTSSARGAINFFFIGIVLLVLGFLIFSGKKELKRLAFALILIFIISTILALYLQPPFLKNKAETILHDMKPRFAVWQMGLKGWQERFLLGWGPENFNVVFCRYFNPCLFINSECGGEVWFDRVHNIIFDTANNSGIVGILSYFSIFAVAVFSLLKICPQIAEKRNLFFPIGMSVLLMVYLGQNLLVFDMINSYLMFFLVLSFVNFLIQRERGAGGGVRPINPVLGAIIVIIITAVFWVGNVQPFQSAVNTSKIITASSKVEDASVFFQKSLESAMEKYEPREQFAQRVGEYFNNPQQNNEALKKAFELAEAEMTKSVEKNNLDFRPRLFLGKLYLSFYHFERDPAKLSLAEKTLEDAVKLSPTNQQGYWYLAETKLNQGKIEESFELLKKAVELEPRLAKSHYYLAVVYKIKGEEGLAKEEAMKAQEIEPSPQIEQFLQELETDSAGT